ncbi:hypothetical protein LTR36_010065 [Oleoguttula mirabilis]|uniref:NAD(P)-binding protein n=1 Tax=Oleoguttula mirabilis TaxID=1507867 RepID=A0AAV9JT35_9PEZI|nr:hypothetical protein LTR36_010065 [Oleoguttula mirabilis]
MSGPSPSAVLSLLRSQLTFHPPIPTSSFTNQTVIVTGANTGLGREAAKHIVQLGAERVILAVRTTSKGEAARKYIAQETRREDGVEVWELDLSSFASVRAFGDRAQQLARLDAVIENAGMWATEHQTVQGHEATITVNVLSTLLLAHLLLPKLQETGRSHPETTPRLTLVTSALHKFATLNARKSDGTIIEALDKPTQDWNMRYNDSKLLLVLYGQKLAATAVGADVCITFLNPGYCLSDLKPARTVGTKAFEKMLARTTDEGAWTLVDAVAAEKAAGRHGKYLDDMAVKRPAPWIETTDGQETAERVWTEINAVLGIAERG